MPNQLPAYLQNLPRSGRTKEVIANLGTMAQPHVSIANGRFALVDTTGAKIQIPKLELDCIIIEINPHKSKVFFGLDKPFDPANAAPPICWSDNGIGPSTASQEPQHETCAGCPMDVWGSKISAVGSKVKQCADQQKVAVYVPEYSPQGLWLLRIPPASLSNFKNYMLRCAQSDLEPYHVVTRVKFEEGVVGILEFASPGYLPETVVPVVTQMVTSHVADAMVGMLDRPRQQGSFLPQAGVAIEPPRELAPPPSMPVATEPRKRGPRRRAEAVAEGLNTQAPFRPTAAPTAPAQFGIDNNAPAPPAGLQEQLNSVFGSK